MNPADILQDGRKILDGALSPHGFVFQKNRSGKSSGGNFASGFYIRGDRKFEFHVRYSLGLVTYHIGSVSLTHELYMHALLGSQGGNHYPDFSEDVMSSFENLKYDLEHYCGDFLSGDGGEFLRCVKDAAKWQSLSRFRRG